MKEEEIDMTQQEKELLLKDLCARLPYGVKVLVKGEKYFNEIKEPYIETLSFGTYLFDDEDITLVPYLRPMSSMTEDEKKEYEMLQVYPGFKTNHTDLTDMYDWLNAHYFDYRGLIPMGLALEAKEGMYRL